MFILDLKKSHMVSLLNGNCTSKDYNNYSIERGGAIFQVGIKLLLGLHTLGIHLFKENKWRKII